MKRGQAVVTPPCKKRPPGHIQDTGAVCGPYQARMKRQGRHEFTDSCRIGRLHSPSLDNTGFTLSCVVTGIKGIGAQRHSCWTRCCCSCCRCCSHSRSSSCWTDSRRAARSCWRTTRNRMQPMARIISGRYTVSGLLRANRSVYGFPRQSFLPIRPSPVRCTA